VAELRGIQSTSRGRRFSETGIAEVLTSSRVAQHPMALYTTGLPILQIALNVELMSESLRSIMGGTDGGPNRVSVTHANLVAYKQANRGLIHYDMAEMQEGLGSVVLGKLYPDPSRAQRVHDIVERLWSEVFAASPDLRVPQPVGCVPELAMFLFLPVPGRFLGEVILEGRGLEYVQASAEWISTLHRSRLSLDKHFDLERELVNMKVYASLVGHHHPELAAEANGLVAPLQELAAAVAPHTETPIHNDFHYQHVLVDEGVSVIDFDEVRLGDENVDLGHFCAHLFLLACRTTSVRAEDVARLQQEFLSSYARHTGWQRDTRFTFFYASTCLKLAKQLCTLRGVRPRPDGQEQFRQLNLVLREASATLRDL
jgi:phosphotransferase family enzyme